MTLRPDRCRYADSRWPGAQRCRLPSSPGQHGAGLLLQAKPAWGCALVCSLSFPSTKNLAGHPRSDTLGLSRGFRQPTCTLGVPFKGRKKELDKARVRLARPLCWTSAPPRDTALLARSAPGVPPGLESSLCGLPSVSLRFLICKMVRGERGGQP